MTPEVAQLTTVEGRAAMPESAARERSHLPALDGLRGIAILLVVFTHALPYQLSKFSDLRGWMLNFLCSTGFGVQLFFVLSGFLITGILLDSKPAPNFFRNFYGRRVLRIFPLYYAVILTVWAIALIHPFIGYELYLRRLPFLLSYTSNIWMTVRQEWTAFNFGYVSMGHFWSLAVEEQFYLIWPAAIFFLSATTLRRLCYFAVPFSLAMRVLFLYRLRNDPGAFVFTTCQLDSLALGALAAILVREKEENVARLRWPFFVIGGIAWVLTCADKDLLRTVGVSAFSIFSCGLLGLCLFDRAQRFFLFRPLRAMGKYSYAMYVFHVLLLPFIIPLRATLGLPLFILFFLAISFTAAWLSWYLFERYFLRLKRFFPSHSGRGWRPQVLANGLV